MRLDPALQRMLLDDIADEEQVVPVSGFEDLYPLARVMLDVLNEHRPGELAGLKGELHRFLNGNDTHADRMWDAGVFRDHTPTEGGEAITNRP